MATFMLHMIFKEGQWCLINEDLSLFGNIISLVFAIPIILSFLIILGVVSLVENIFMLPFWGIYNLCHKKQFRKSYIEFFNF